MCFLSCKENREKFHSVWAPSLSGTHWVFYVRRADFASPSSLVDRETFLTGKRSEAVERDGIGRALRLGRWRRKPEMDSGWDSEAPGMAQWKALGSQCSRDWPSREKIVQSLNQEKQQAPCCGTIVFHSATVSFLIKH